MTATFGRAVAAAAAFALAAWVWCAAVPAQAQSGQTSAGAPLQLLPGDKQATRGGQKRTTVRTASSSSKTVARRKAKQTRATAPAHRTAAKRAPQPNAKRVAQPKPKSNAKTAATTSQSKARIRAMRSRPAQRAIAAAVPETRADDDHELNEDQDESLAFAPMPAQQAAVPPVPRPAPRSAAPAPHDNVMRDGDSVSLVGRLPWWRNSPMQQIHYGSKGAESQVMEAAEAWLLVSAPAAPESATPDDDERIVVADASELNTIDRSLATVPAPAPPTYWNSLIALLGGAFAAAAAAAMAARFLLARAA